MGTQAPLASTVSHALQRGMHVPASWSQTSPSPQQKRKPFRSLQVRVGGQHASDWSGSTSHAPVEQQNPPQSASPAGHLQVLVRASQCLPVFAE
jgi:hypothetical protein